MIELPLRQLPLYLHWFPGGTAGPTALAEHVLATRTGRLWADRADRPRTVAVGCAGHVLLSGDPGAFTEPATLAPLSNRYVLAPARFLPALGSAYDRVVPWERMVYVHTEEPAVPRPPRGVTVRRLVDADATALAILGSDSAWIHASWGGPGRLAKSGHAWGAFHRGHLLAVACTYFLGSRYEDIAVVTAPERRREQLALSCVVALCADVEARGRTASWTCSRYNRPSRLLAWTAGFRLEREYVHYATGTLTTKAVSGSRNPAVPA